MDLLAGFNVIYC